MFAPRDDWEALAARFAREQRLRLPDALPRPNAEHLHGLIANIPYALMVTQGGKGLALADSDLAAMSDQQRYELQQEIFAAAAKGEGFAYEGHQLAESANPALRGILDLINAPETIERVRQLTGMPDITHADGQATRYRAGQFLTRHLDDPEGQQRRAAYVLSLTPNWHPDWGGLLQFYERNGAPRDAWAPGFNVLSLFNVRAHVHSVTFVTPFAAGERLSITGWFRAGEPS